MGDLSVLRLGRVDYAEALERQLALVEDRRRGSAPDTLLLLEHPPVVTLGRGAREENLRVGPPGLAARGIDLHRVSRGGDVTFHGPGQLVGYLVVDLAARGERDLVAFLRRIETALAEASAALGVATRTIGGMTGLFAADAQHPPRKLASIGVGARGWVTYHGFALNVDLDPADFDVIVPCGLAHVEMTSLERELGGDAPADLSFRAREAVAAACERRWS